MEFSGLEAADLNDVRALNARFLEYLSGPQGGRLRATLPGALNEVVAALADRQIKRLAEAPFLLMSCQERNDDYWRPFNGEQVVHDLFAPAVSDPAAQLTSAALGFVWQLSRKNPYAARLVSGATLNWCEQLSACSLFDVLQRAAIDSQLLAPRLADNPHFWHRLLSAGLSSTHSIRRAAHLCALQSVLSPDDSKRTQRFRAAACRSRAPALQIREDRKE